MARRTPLARHLHDLANDLLDTIWMFEAHPRPLTVSEQQALTLLEGRVQWLRALADKHAKDAERDTGG